MFDTPKRKRPAPTAPTPPVHGAPAALGSRQSAADFARRQQQALGRSRGDAAPQVRILTGHGALLGSHQSASFEAAQQHMPLNAGRLTGVRWELLRNRDDGAEVVAAGSGDRFSASPSQPGHYTVRCVVESLDGPSAFPAASTAVAPRRPADPGAHPYNPYQDPRDQAAQDAELRGDRRRRVLARDEHQFTVLDPETYTRTLLDHQRADQPLGSLEEELQLLPARNEANREADQPAMAAVDAQSDALRALVGAAGFFPGMGAPGSDSDRRIQRVHAVLSQNDGREVRLRLFLGTVRRGTERLVRLVELPVMNEVADASKVRAFDGSPYRQPGDRFGSFMTALNGYVQNGPHGQGVLRYEVEGEPALAGTVTKGPSDLEQAAGSFDQVARVAALLALIPPIALPCRVAGALFAGGAAALRLKDKYNKAQDNAAEAVGAAASLLEFGAGIAPEGTGRAVIKASKGMLEAGQNAAEVAQALSQHERVEPDKALTVLKDALAFGRVVSPEVFAPRHYSVQARRVIVQLSQAYELGDKVVKYATLPEDFSEKFAQLAATEGLSDAERRLRVAELMGGLASGD
ncbi:hypothetical protein [Deinococcus aquaedulcis]|uniref:hypothetical protein n=1 Tax=Deinococcus aquaedulcis TaxID=2840455 RepID=UPI001C835095|nr:hypothetical protein [Deinococcus aquaedulcis]